jgi:hypothetical protein
MAHMPLHKSLIPSQDTPGMSRRLSPRPVPTARALLLPSCLKYGSTDSLFHTVVCLRVAVRVLLVAVCASPAASVFPAVVCIGPVVMHVFGSAVCAFRFSVCVPVLACMLAIAVPVFGLSVLITAVCVRCRWRSS